MTGDAPRDHMRALIVTRHGGDDVLEVQQRPVPRPGPGQLTVDVVAAGVNFIDVYRREGVYPGRTPFVLGTECAGRVRELGEGVAGFAVGNLVASASAGHGSHAEVVLLDATSTVAVPAGVSGDVAAAAMLQGMTAHYLVNSTYRVTAGDRVLVHAAAGGVGLLLVQLAAALGAQVIGTVGSAAKVALAGAAGAEHVIRYDASPAADDLGAAIRELAPDGVHVAYDGVGRATFDASLATLRPRGTLVLFGAASGQVPPFELQRLNTGGSLYVTRPTLVNYTATRAELLERSGAVFDAITAGTLDIAIGGRYRLDDAARAYRDLEGRTTTGKLLLEP